MSKKAIKEFHVVEFGKGYLGFGFINAFTHDRDYKMVKHYSNAIQSDYEKADKLAQLYGGKVKKVVTYIEDVEAYS